MDAEIDVIVVGGGNAGFCAAHAASEAGARVLLMDKAGEEWAGGNTFFTAGAFRTTFEGLGDLVALLDEDEPRVEATDVTPYRPEDFERDMMRVTSGRCDPDLTQLLAQNAAETMTWLRSHGIRFRLSYDRQSFERGGRYRFWGGLAIATPDGGQGLIACHQAAAARAGVEVRYDAPVDGLIRNQDDEVVAS
jgi:tricarballylate dehydrogenase